MAVHKKEQSLTCSKCKTLIHFKCSNLPAYMFYSLHMTKQKFTCTETQPELHAEFNRTNDGKRVHQTQDNNCHDILKDMESTV